MMHKLSNKVLIVEQDPNIVSFIENLISSQYHVLSTTTAEMAYPLLHNHEISVIVCNECLKGENGLYFLNRITKMFPLLQPVLMSEGINEDLLAFAINDVGVLKYLKKPLNKGDVKKAMTSAYMHYRKAVEIDKMQHEYSRILKEIKSIPYIARRLQQATPIILSNIKTTALAASSTVTLLVSLFFGLGIFAFFLMYILKRFLGIDIFSDSHLLDIL